MFLLFALSAHYRVRKYKPKIHDDTLETETNSFGFKNKGTARFLYTTPAYTEPSSKSKIASYFEAGTTVKYIMLGAGDFWTEQNPCQIWAKIPTPQGTRFCCAKRNDQFRMELEK